MNTIINTTIMLRSQTTPMAMTMSVKIPMATQPRVTAVWSQFS